MTSDKTKSDTDNIHIEPQPIMLRRLCRARGLDPRARLAARPNTSLHWHCQYGSCTRWLSSAAASATDGTESIENEATKVTPMVAQYLARKKEYPGTPQRLLRCYGIRLIAKYLDI